MIVETSESRLELSWGPMDGDSMFPGFAASDELLARWGLFKLPRGVDTGTNYSPTDGRKRKTGK
jgi:hypothetical protein